ncbi:hypothetical protein Q4534_10440 [Cyclobacterium sp. 1_MG-2023]|uniref:DUF6503 family protein n=1 Tax=Cyclobacterium sp. 1_MG-2023 TaxID=3062681 RepID=UPI0026E47B49|nr:DUF6503 family protein [Cyclobacterium sp. 1_MG-2023]MDO6437829.1 hypothetical protein [Cyclobacterium sp. 1_MG-2023]
MKLNLQTLLIITVLFMSCKEQKGSDEKTSFQNKGHQLVYEMVQTVGDYSKLAEKKDVVYTYKYQTPDGKTDLSTEKYIFDGELSYGAYKQHERTLPEYEGLIEQGYDGKAYWLRHKGNYIDDPVSLKRVKFNRPTNFYWFTMFQKLLDPGLTYEYLGEKSIEEKRYDIVKISFDSINEKPTDIYQIYINKDTKLVDQFLFTVAEVGVIDQPLLMKLEYEEIDGLLIPTQRIYKGSNWEAEVTDAPWIKVTWSNIQFNNGLSRTIFEK